MSRDAKGVPAFLAGATSERFVPAAGGKMIPCNGIHILPARSEPVAMATRARAGECRLSRRRGDATHGERRTMALGDPAREAPSGDHGGAMATTGSHRAQPFARRGRRERRRTKRDPWGALQGAAARATPRVAGAPACERGRISRKAEQRALGKPRPFGRGFPCLKQTIASLFQFTSWHRRKSTCVRWSQSRPTPRSPAPVRHRLLGRLRSPSNPALR